MGVPEGLRDKGLRSVAARCFLAEFLGTFVLVAFGDGSVAQAVTTGVGGESLNSYLSICWGFFCGITFGVYISGGVSGGHINPAVTFAMAVIGRCPWKLVPVYFVGQYLGAFVASALIYGIYWPGISANDYATFGGIWASKPYAFTNLGTGLGDQIFGALLLVLIVMALTDEKNMNPHKGIIPVLVGLAVFGVGLSFGINGFPINPARDLGPRIFEAILFGGEPFSNGDYWFWVPIVGPHLGAMMGAAIYLLFIEMHHPNGDADDVEVNRSASMGKQQEEQEEGAENDNRRRNRRNRDDQGSPLM